MGNRMLWVLAVAVLCTAGASAQGPANDPGARDTLFVESVAVDAGQKAVVHVNFFNDEELAALTIPLAWDSPDITLDSVPDSVLFAGSRVAYVKTKPVSVYNDEQVVVIGVVVFMEAFIPPGEGLLITLYFDVPPGTPDQFVHVDSTTYAPAELLFTNTNASNFTPVMKPGVITIGDPEIPPHIVLSQQSMVFDGIVGYPNPQPKTLSVTNSGEGTLTWTASVSSTWLSVNPPSGTAPSNTSIAVNISGLGEGTYDDTVVITSPEADNSPQFLPVRLEIITMSPTIVFTPSAFTVSAVQGGANPEDRYLYIWTDVPASELNWTVTNATGWLSLTPASGVSGDSVALQFDISGLSYGLHYDTIVISDPDATNSPQFVPVTLQIVSNLPVLELDPSILHLVIQAGDNALPRQVLVYNSGEGVMTFETEEHSSRITGIVPSSGTAPETIQLQFKTTPVSPGDYYDTVTVTSPEAINSPQYLIVHFHVSMDPARIALAPGSISFTYYECWQGPNAFPPTKTFQVLNLGADSMYWWLTHSTAWLTTTQESGTDNAIILLGLAAQGFPVGTYYDTIVVSSDDAINSPQRATVTLNVVPGTEAPEIVLENTIINIPAKEQFGTLLGLAAVTKIYNQNPGCMDYWIEEDIPWLKFIDSIGSAPALPRVALEIGDYTYGVYPDSFEVYSEAASNSPVKGYINMLVWRYHGDVNWSGYIDVADVIYLVNYIFKHGAPPQPEVLVGDCNCDWIIMLDDVFVLVNYIFRHGNTPCGNP